MTQEQFQVERLKQVMTAKGYGFFEHGHYNLNIIGIRSNNVKAGSYDDFITCTFKDKSDNWVCKHWKATTDAGTHWLKNPMNTKGTALLVPNQYKKTWEIGLHQGKYRALRQCAPVKVFRDSNKDLIQNYNVASIEEGIFGINIHRSNPAQASVLNEKWSAGCQVFSSPKDFDEFMAIVDEASRLWGNKFTYTLLTEADFAV
jgi:hypothetical protein